MKRVKTFPLFLYTVYQLHFCKVSYYIIGCYFIFSSAAVSGDDDSSDKLIMVNYVPFVLLWFCIIHFKHQQPIQRREHTAIIIM